MMYSNGILAWAAEFLTPEIAEQIEVVPLGEVVQGSGDDPVE